VRLFAAVWPPDSVLAALAGTSLPPASGLRWTPPERWHVTLAFYGEVPTHEVSDLTAALADGVGAVRTAPVAYLGDRTCRLGHHVLAAPVAGLDALAAPVMRATRRWIGDDRRFRGHLTLARARRQQGIPHPLVDHPLFPDGDHPLFPDGSVQVGRLGWEVTEACLVESATIAGDHEYRTLASLEVGRRGRPEPGGLRIPHTNMRS
jgi:2'-5' RNA ligase